MRQIFSSCWFEECEIELVAQSQTSLLWLSYARQVQVLLDFIRAEQCSDWVLYLSSWVLYLSSRSYRSKQLCKICKVVLLKDFLLFKVKPREALPNNFTTVIDGGALLFASNWQQGEWYGDIFYKYAQKCHQLLVNVVVYDG